MKFDPTYISKLYGGFLGKVAGVIHGAPVEGWSHEKIRHDYGELTGYPRLYRNFAADDDINGPVFYMRALNDFGCGLNTGREQMAQTLLNYVADGHGFFWWGGYGVSSEHTVYANLTRGISATLSGSAKLNGNVLSQQIGGQIFSDCWGLTCPGDPCAAAALAEKMSGVTHDGEGVIGGRFVAAAVSAAFTAANVEEMLTAALAQLPPDSVYARMAYAVTAECRANGDDWEKSLRFVQQHYAYERFGGVCPVISNAAVLVLALVHGQGDFDRTLNISTMCGWDTDCNSGNVGAMLGVLTGAEGIGEKWLAPLHDFFCASSVLGSLNIQTVSQAALEAMRASAAMGLIEPTAAWAALLAEPEGAHFHFEFPTATHAMRAEAAEGSSVWLRNTDEHAHTGSRSLRVLAPMLKDGEPVRLYHQTCYRPNDFDDSRYDPDFSPTVYPGDRVSAWFRAEGEGIHASPYARDRITDARMPAGARTALSPGEWTQVAFTVPGVRDVLVEEIGFQITGLGGNEPLYMDDLQIIRHPDYALTLCRLPVERWNEVRSLPASLTCLHGLAEVSGEGLCVSGPYPDNEAYTGHVGWEDYRMETELVPALGGTHRVLFRVQGAMRGYGAALLADGRFALCKKVQGRYRELCGMAFPWQPGGSYRLLVEARGSEIRATLNGEATLVYTDETEPYLHGCVGFGNAEASRTAFLRYGVHALPEI